MQQIVQLNFESELKKIRFHSSGEAAAILTQDNTIHLVDIKSGRVSTAFQVSGWLMDFAFLPDKEHLVCIEMSGTEAYRWRVAIYRATTGQVEHSMVTGDVRSVIVNSVTEQILLGSIEEPAQVTFYDFNLTYLNQLLLATPIIPFGLAVSGNGLLLAVDGVGTQLWKPDQNNTLIWDYWKDGYTGGADVWETTAMALTPDGHYIAIGHWGMSNTLEKVHVYDLQSSSSVGWFSQGLCLIAAVALSADGRYLACVGSESENARYPYTQVWDVRDGTLIQDIASGAVQTVAFSPTENLLLTGGSNGSSLTIWELP